MANLMATTQIPRIAMASYRAPGALPITCHARLDWGLMREKMNAMAPRPVFKVSNIHCVVYKYTITCSVRSDFRAKIKLSVLLTVLIFCPLFFRLPQLSQEKTALAHGQSWSRTQISCGQSERRSHPVRLIQCKTEGVLGTTLGQSEWLLQSWPMLQALF